MPNSSDCELQSFDNDEEDVNLIAKSFEFRLEHRSTIEIGRVATIALNRQPIHTAACIHGRCSRSAPSTCYRKHVLIPVASIVVWLACKKVPNRSKHDETDQQQGNQSVNDDVQS